MNKMQSGRCGSALVWAWALCWTGCTAGSVCAQQPEPTLTFLATDPAAQATLGKQEPFYIQFKVNSAQAVGVMPDAYYRGEPVLYGLGSSGISQLPEGGGTAVAKIFFWGDNHTPIDEVRLYVGDPKNPLSGKIFSLPVKLIWSGQPAAPRVLADWAQQSLSGKQTQPSVASPVAKEKTYAAAIITLVLAVLGVSLWSVRAWRRR